MCEASNIRTSSGQVHLSSSYNIAMYTLLAGTAALVGAPPNSHGYTYMVTHTVMDPLTYMVTYTVIITHTWLHISHGYTYTRGAVRARHIHTNQGRLACEGEEKQTQAKAGGGRFELGLSHRLGRSQGGLHSCLKTMRKVSSC